MLELNSNSEILSFVDDTVILYKSSIWQNLKEKTENDYPKILNWLTCYLPFTLYACEISEANSVKYLGIMGHTNKTNCTKSKKIIKI